MRWCLKGATNYPPTFLSNHGVKFGHFISKECHDWEAWVPKKKYFYLYETETKIIDPQISDDEANRLVTNK